MNELHSDVQRDVYFVEEWKVDVFQPINARNEAAALSLVLKKIQSTSVPDAYKEKYGLLHAESEAISFCRQMRC